MSSLEPVAVVLAAGQGKRMKSRLPKPYLRVQGRRMVWYVLQIARQSGCRRLLGVVGDARHPILGEFSQFQVEWIEQKKPLGTGHALQQAEAKLKGYRGPVLVLMGDAVLLRPETARGAVRTWADKQAEAVIITGVLDAPTAYGRILRNAQGKVVGIVEEVDASREQRRIKEINSGNYVFTAPGIFALLEQLRPDNEQGEYYLTDAIRLLKDKGKRVTTFESCEAEEALGINTRAELAEAESRLRKRLSRQQPRER